MIMVSIPIAAGPNRHAASKADMDKNIEAGKSGELRTLIPVIAGSYRALEVAVCFTIP